MSCVCNCRRFGHSYPYWIFSHQTLNIIFIFLNIILQFLLCNLTFQIMSCDYSNGLPLFSFLMSSLCAFLQSSLAEVLYYSIDLLFLLFSPLSLNFPTCYHLFLNFFLSFFLFLLTKLSCIQKYIMILLTPSLFQGSKH